MLVMLVRLYSILHDHIRADIELAPLYITTLALSAPRVEKWLGKAQDSKRESTSEATSQLIFMCSRMFRMLAATLQSSYFTKELSRGMLVSPDSA
jgi:hypothetical protein